MKIGDTFETEFSVLSQEHEKYPEKHCFIVVKIENKIPIVEMMPSGLKFHCYKLKSTVIDGVQPFQL